MKKIAIFIIAFAISLSVSAQNYSGLWKEFDNNIENLLPESAQKTLDKIEKQAQKDKNDIQLLKMVVKRCEVFNLTEEIPSDTILSYCQYYLPKLSEPCKTLLTIDLINNKPMFSMFGDFHYDTIIDYSDADYLKNFSMKDYVVLFEDKEKTFDIDLQPTLYDYAVSSNITQYRNINDKKKIDDCYQKLMQFDLENNYLKAYYNNKFDYLGGCIYTEKDFEKYDEFENECTDNETIVRIKLAKMNYYIYKNEYLKASKICDEVLAIINKKHSVYEDCVRLKENIFRKTIEIKMKEVQVPNQPIAVGLTYRNTTNPSYRIYKLTSSQFFDVTNNGKKDFYKSLKNFELAKSGTIDIPKEEDLLKHSSLVALPALKPGCYVLVFSNCDKFDDEDNLESIPFQVSSLTYLTLSPEKNMNIYIVDRETSQPVANATAHFYKKIYSYDLKRYVCEPLNDIVSDKNGFLQYLSDKNSSFYIDLYHNDDTLISFSNNYFSTSNNEFSQVETYIYTDRALYRPGQTVQIKGVVIKNVNGEKQLLTDYETEVSIYDQNFGEVETKKFKTDEFGAFSGSFELPKNRLKGYFNLNWQTWFRVEEYKRPTFEVLFDDVEKEYRIGDSVTVKGKVMALSGFGLGNVKYKYTVSRKKDYPYYKYWGYNPWFNTKYETFLSGENHTLNDGSFAIGFLLSEDDEKRLNNPEYTYKIEVEATSDQGETQAETYYLTASYNKYIIKVDSDKKPLDYQYSPTDVNDLKDLNVFVTNTIGKPAKTNIECKLFRVKDLDGYKMDFGKFDRQLLSDELLKEYFPNYDFYNYDKSETKELVHQYVTDVNGKTKLIPDNLKLQPGKYVFKLRSTEDTLSVYSDDFFIYDLSSKKMPCKSMLWTLLDNNSVHPGDVVNCYIGSSEKNVSALVIAMSGNKILKSERINLNNNIAKFSYKIKEEDRGNVELQVVVVKYNMIFSETKRIQVPFDNMQLGITLHTERNKMLPGETETWSVTIKDYKNNPAVTSLMAGMYDAALDNLFENQHYNRWDLNTLPSKNYNNSIQSNNSYSTTSREQYANLGSVQYYWNVSLFSQIGLLPNTSFWGYRSDQKITTSNYPKSAYMDSEMVEETMVFRTAQEEQYKMPESQVESDNTADSKPLKIRKDFNETAFFYPVLKTDKNGNATFTFTMPDALTRWKLRLLAYTKDLKVGNLEETFVTQQPLMIMADMPRFAYDEDTLWLVANVINLSDEALAPSAKLDVFDDADNVVDMIISEQSVNMEPIPAGQSRSVRWKVAMKKDLNVLKFRFSAITDGFSDAEQHEMPVLSTEIYLTQTFALTAKAHSVKEYNFDINREGERNHKITLHFNENPLWTAIHAMPYIAEGDEKYAMTAFYRYFVNKMSLQIMESHPEIAEKIENTYKNDTLSELQKHEDLKAILLQETPWVLEAANEAKQRANIVKLFDSESVQKNIESARDVLEEKQTVNGGWSWIEGCPESGYITQYILSGLAHLGLDDQMTENAFHFIENQIVERYLKLDTQKKKNDAICDFMTMKGLYTMSFFNYETNDKFNEAKAFFIKKLFNDWKLYGVEEQSYIALILNRNNHNKVADLIVKSLRERAIKNELGMYWRNCDLMAEVRILEAFNEIDPKTDEIDAMRLWILTQKRTNMWENERASAEAISALVNTGSNWTENGDVTLTINGKTVKSNDTTLYEPDVKTRFIASLPVTIDNNSNHVAWGGLYRQYFVPIDKVQKHNDAMKITRELIMPENVKVGDKVTVKITFENNQDMDFVYLKDLRGACFEPTEQLSRYHWNNGLWYYQSTSDVSMEFFFERLPKGKHTVSYDVYVTKEGSFSAGYSFIQCQYAPEFGAYSNGARIYIE